MTAPRRLSRSDAAWLHMERDDNPMVVNGVFELEGRLSLEAARELVRRRLLRFERFGMAIVDAASGHPRWARVELELERHVVEHAEVGDSAALHRFIDAEISRPLPFDRPPWRMVVVPRPGERTVLLCRLHHSIADGMALMRVLLSISDEHAEGEEGPRGGRRSLVQRGRGLVASVLRRPRGVLALGRGYGESAARLVLRRPDPPTALRGPLGSRKRTAWSQPIELALVKRIGRARGATINDVLMATVAGALRRYLDARGGHPEAVRAMVPVDLRRPGGPITLGNRFGLVMLPLPLAPPDPAARLRETKRRMDRLKGEHEAVVAFVFLEALGWLDRRLEAPFIRFFSDKVSLVLTNVPGPRQPLHLGGHEIRRLMFWVPQSGSLGLGISVLSYAGRVFVGVMCDEAVIPEPHALVEAFDGELAALRDAVLGDPGS